MKKSDFIDKIIKIEGGYVNDPDDSGGATNMGVTVAVARAAGYRGDMSKMPKAVAVKVYEGRYWDPVGGDEMADLSPTIMAELFDSGVLHGPARAANWLQTVLNALNMRGDHYPDVVIDGDFGPATLAAATAYVGKRGKEGEDVLVELLNSLQGAFMLDLVGRREKDERYMYGWAKNRVMR
jgi:lysozyme family protein